MRSLENLVNATSDRISWRVVTSDRDSGDRQAYPDIQPREWNRVGNADVFYVPPGERTLKTTVAVLQNEQPDRVYLNSLTNPFFTLSVIRAHRRLQKKPQIILAPRGELHPGALAVKRRKKQLFLMATKTIGFYRDVRWHATSDEEADHIRDHFGHDADITVISNLAAPVPDVDAKRPRGNPLKVVFLSRLVPKKNLLGAIEAMQTVTAPVDFDIYGPHEDLAYIDQCRTAAEQLPSNVRLRFQGALPHTDVLSTLATYDVFLFPTLGENFGHVIAEALAAGCVPIISDQTPWRDLQGRGLGWDLPLRPELFRDAVEQCATMPESDFADMRTSAVRFARDQQTRSDELVNSYYALFGSG